MKQNQLMPRSRWRRLSSDPAAGEDNAVFALLERMCWPAVWLVEGANGTVVVGGGGR